MSPALADQVNAVELAGRAATVERRLELDRLPTLADAGALEGTSVRALLGFDSFAGHATVAVRIEGVVVLPCQRCLQPCVCGIDESTTLAVVASDEDEVPGGYEPLLGDAERLSLGALIEEQVLLGLPLVPMHVDVAECGMGRPTEAEAATRHDDRQRPFANLRDLLDQGSH